MAFPSVEDYTITENPCRTPSHRQITHQKKNLYLKVWVMPMPQALQVLRASPVTAIDSTASGGSGDSLQPRNLNALRVRALSLVPGQTAPPRLHTLPPLTTYARLLRADIRFHLHFYFHLHLHLHFSSLLRTSTLRSQLQTKKTIDLDFIQNAVHCQVPRHLLIPLPDPAGPEEPGLGKLLLMCELRLQ